MKTRRKVIASFIGAAFLAIGIGGFISIAFRPKIAFVSPIQQIDRGFSENQVIAILGRPTSTLNVSENLRTTVWDVPECTLFVTYDKNGIVIDKFDDLKMGRRSSLWSRLVGWLGF